LLGLGAADARWCFFGRDPGEQEVRLHRPFVGDAGRKIRAILPEFGLGEPDIFWINTVPFKPVGNKPWSMAVRRRCQPALLRLLGSWNGTCVITFGEAAFKWFGLGSTDLRREIDRFWGRADKYEASMEVALEIAGAQRTFTLLPVPHPSGANAVWAKAFPDLLRGRLRDAAS
jgi:uracil-DNA glycosylase family 4